MTRRNPRAKPATVQLAHGPNPDRDGDGYWAGAPDAPRSAEVRVSSFEEAARVCQAFIAKHELGGGNWYGGAVRDARGRQIAYVSYNGRVWPGRASEWTPGTKEIPLKRQNPGRRRNPEIDWAAEALRQAERLLIEMGPYAALCHARARRALARTDHNYKQWAAIEFLIKKMS